MITIELLFAAKNHVWHQYLTMPACSTVQDALDQSGLYAQYPETKSYACGIFGELCALDTPLQPDDRVEVYRPLVFDPMESRRRRAAHRTEKKQSENKPGQERLKPSAAASMIVNRD